MSADRIFTEAQCVALAKQIFSMQQGGGETSVDISSHWSGELRWGRNRVMLASDRRETTINITRTFQERSGGVQTSQLDPAALAAAVRAAERKLQFEVQFNHTVQNDDLATPYRFKPEYLKPAIWSDATYNLTTEERGRVARALIERAEAQGMLSAGYLAVEAQCSATVSPREQRYLRVSQGQCSMTVRDPEGTGSGWAGKSSYDWTRINASALAERALEKCLQSRHPVTLEPGRYTVILEPQAVSDLLELLPFYRPWAEGGGEALWWLKPGFSKLGLKVTDERVTIGQDPMDPDLGVVPVAANGEAYRSVNWIEHGVLTALAHNRQYALQRLNENLGLPGADSFRMVGGDTSVAEMIATTKRGLLVTRLWDARLLPPPNPSYLATGLTRDGLWLIENGKITKPVKNFRFLESPIFMLNQLEQLGPAEPVFRPGGRDGLLLRPAVVPPLKVRDFNFIALVDAV